MRASSVRTAVTAAAAAAIASRGELTELRARLSVVGEQRRRRRRSRRGGGSGGGATPQ